MTQNEKELLIKDLCGRLPYGVIIQVKDWAVLDAELKIGHINRLQNDDLELKPYLFPLSSMTEEQRKEYDSIIYHSVELHCDRYYEVIDVDSFEELQDFYHINRLDYRGLIPMDLAIDATNLNIY